MPRFNIKDDAEEFITELRMGSAERIYAMDFFAYALQTNDGERIPRPDVQEYNLGPRVGEYLRDRLIWR